MSGQEHGDPPRDPDVTPGETSQRHGASPPTGTPQSPDEDDASDLPPPSWPSPSPPSLPSEPTSPQGPPSSLPPPHGPSSSLPPPSMPPQPSLAGSAPSTGMSTGMRIGLIVGGVVLVLVLVAGFLLFRFIRDNTPEAGFGYGDNPTLDALWNDCAAGDMGACDSLYRRSELGSRYEEFGDTCGDRTFGGTWCTDLDQ